MADFLLPADCGLLCVYRRGREAHTGLCTLGSLNIRCGDVGGTCDRRMEEADSGKVTDDTEHLSPKLWSFVGNRHSPSELQSCSTSPIQRRGLEWGRGSWRREIKAQILLLFLHTGTYNNDAGPEQIAQFPEFYSFPD